MATEMGGAGMEVSALTTALEHYRSVLKATPND
jgi:hypothetical protein